MTSLRIEAAKVLHQGLGVDILTKKERLELIEEEAKKYDDLFKAIDALGIKAKKGENFGEKRIIIKDGLALEIQRFDSSNGDENNRAYSLLVREENENHGVYLVIMQNKPGEHVSVTLGEDYQGLDNLIAIVDGFIAEEIQPREVVQA